MFPNSFQVSFHLMSRRCVTCYMYYITFCTCCQPLVPKNRPFVHCFSIVHPYQTSNNYPQTHSGARHFYASERALSEAQPHPETRLHQQASAWHRANREWERPSTVVAAYCPNVIKCGIIQVALAVNLGSGALRKGERECPLSLVLSTY